ncbi:MAG TPA: ArgE/DapE family deacylase [Terriglobia bacterium]|nr:ArgE/DapE family deacylase [Terriglobia bacterium]
MIDGQRVAGVLADLVRMESVNPELVPGGSGELAIARYVVDFLKTAGLEAKLEEVSPGRFNTVGILRGREGGRSLMFNGHLDTVGVQGMAEPFAARIEGGRLYGRGAQDMKGGLAAALVAVEALAREGRPQGDVMVAAVADEEYQSIGTRALLKSGVRADAAVVMEPTAMQVVIAHKGFAWADIETEGRAAHGSRPEEGLDAIAFMGRVLGEIEELQARLASSSAHLRLGHGSVHASLISGGQELSSYPARCKLSVERRLLPGENSETLAGELHQILAKLAAADPNFRATSKLGYSALALETPEDALIVRALAGPARQVLGQEAKLGGQSFWTDAALLSEAGIPSVLFGPTGAGLHSRVEYVELEDVARTAEVFVACAKEFCAM